MKIDKHYTKLAPKGWEIWTTSGRKWQAMKRDATSEDGAWGPMRYAPELAVQDAVNLSNAARSQS